MITISPFKALRPNAEFAKQLASKPYDVISSREARIEAQGNPLSYLHITKSEIDLPDTISPYAIEVYKKAKENLTAFINRNILFQDSNKYYYIYRLTMPGINNLPDHIQTGLVCCSSVNDYENGLIKKHEHTRPEKEEDRIQHIINTEAQTGNVFLAYKNLNILDEILLQCISKRAPIYDFTADDNVNHKIWIVNNAETIERITEVFKNDVPCTYIADGHHRAASAAKARKHFKSEEANFFLTTLFPANQLSIMSYNRVVKDLNGMTTQIFIDQLKLWFHVTESNEPVEPNGPNIFGMYLLKHWYRLELKKNVESPDLIENLEVTILQRIILEPLLGIADQRTDKRIDFVGGIRGLGELEKRVDSGEMAVAFSIPPVTVEQLFAISDENKIMPPKSTWFEPKLRDGLFTHSLNA